MTASSYIPTTTSAAQRQADAPVISGTPFSDFYNTFGTLLAKYRDAGWMHVNSPALSSLDLGAYIDGSGDIEGDVLQRISFFTRELSTATIEQIKAAL